MEEKNLRLKYSSLLVQTGVLVYLLSIPMGPSFVPLGRELPLVLIIIGMSFTRIHCGTGRSYSPPFKLLVPYLFFALSTFLSILFSSYPYLSLSHAVYAPVAFLFFFAVQEIAVDLLAFRRIFLALSIVIFLLGADGIYQGITGTSLLSGSQKFAGRVTGSLPHPNDLALIPILLPFALAVLIQTHSSKLRAFVLASLPFAFITVILSQSRNAWFGLGIGFGVFAIFGRSRKIVAALACLIVILFFVTYALDIGNVPQRMQSIMHTHSDPRVALWLTAWEMFKEAPLLGKGIHTFGEFYPMYLNRIRLPKYVVPDIAKIPWAHNLFLEILAERGLIGLFGFLFPTVAMGYLLLSIYMNKAPSDVQTFALGLAGSLLTFLGMGIFDLTFFKDWVLLIFCVLGALIARLPTLATSSFEMRPG